MLSTADIVMRILIAMACGGVVGWDREARGRAAGLRTHMLVSVGSAAFALIARMIMLDMIATDATWMDPLRLLAAIVGGVGFLGAGSIIQSRGQISGLTTAASVWVVASAGAAAGWGFVMLAIVVTAATAVTLNGLAGLDKFTQSRDEHES